ncbi:hypothetical protein FRB95_002004, partial [Tulasnella sp. JGI-2019a]
MDLSDKLPALKTCHIHIDEHSPFDSGLLSQFLGPSVWHLTISVSPSLHPGPQILSVLHSRIPNLTALRIIYPGNSRQAQVLWGAVGLAVAQLRNLVELEIPFLPWDVIFMPTNLGSLPLLERFRIASEVQTSFCHNPNMLNWGMSITGTFASLTHFSYRDPFRGAHWALNGMLASVSDTSKLRQAAIDVKTLGNPGNVLLFSMLSRFCSLSEVSIHLQALLDPSCRWENIRPILECTAMTSFRFVSRSPLDSHSDVIKDIARSWPRLRDLHIECKEIQNRDTRAKLQDLRLLAQGCPELEVLSYSFDRSGLVKHSPQLSRSKLCIINVQWTEADRGEDALWIRHELELYWPQLGTGHLSMSWNEDGPDSQLAHWKAAGFDSG